MEHIVPSFVANAPNRNSSLLKYSRPTPLRHQQGQGKLLKLGRGIEAERQEITVFPHIASAETILF
jgi:hypothetical protein